MLPALPTFVDGFPTPHPWGEGSSSTLAHNLAVTGWDLNP